jgi:hypothetical protein
MVTSTHFIVDFLYQKTNLLALRSQPDWGFKTGNRFFYELTTPYFSSSDGHANRFLTVFSGDGIIISGMYWDD